MRTRLIPAILTLGMALTVLTAVLPPTAAAADDEPQEQAVVAAQVAADEKSVALSASGDALANAERVVFVVRPQGADASKTLRHEAVRRADGSWAATAFIAANGFDQGPVPYNCRVASAVHRLFDTATGHHIYTSDLNEADDLTQGTWLYEGVAWAEPVAEDAPATDEPSDSEMGADDEGASNAGQAEDPSNADGDGIGDPADALGLANSAPDDPVDDGEPANPTDPEGSETSHDPENPPAADKSDRSKVYRLFNLENGEHFYTTDAHEYVELPNQGWHQEGVAFRSDPEKGIAVYRIYDPQSGLHLFTTDSHEREVRLAEGWIDEDIAWYGASVNEDATWCASTKGRFHDSAGTYEVEVQAYAEPATQTKATSDTGSALDASLTDPTADAQGQTLGTATFAITEPTASLRIENADHAKGTFDVVVANIVSPSGVSRVSVPTWTTPNGQRDIVWYDAELQSDGTYRAHVDIARHSFCTSFSCHAYLKAGNGLNPCVAQANYELTLENYIAKSGGPYTYRVAIYNPGNVSRVQVPSWSDANGQDDIVWFDASNEGNGWWSATVDARRFHDSGACHAHVYADGTYRGGVSFTVQPWEILEWRYRNMLDRVWNLSSPSTYLLAVDTSNCFVGVFRGSRGNWMNSTWWDCAPGTRATPTVKGVFSVGSRGYAFGHGYTCYYWTQFYNDYLFHSIKYYEGTFTPLDPTLGSPASLGCVRLDIQNAKWIYDNVPSGTTVLVY